MNYAAIKKTDVANGPGVRVSLFVSGCTHHCKGCFNAETWDFSYGKPFDSEAEAEIFKALDHSYIRGFSLLGGEPFEEANRKGLAGLLKRIKERFPQKDIWCYSGYTFDDDMLSWVKKGSKDTEEMLSSIDVLVDGEFVEAKKNLRLPFRGSENQRIIDVPQSLKEEKVVIKI